MQDIKMPLNTLRKDRFKHFSGHATRLTSCLFILTMWTRVTDSSVLTDPSPVKMAAENSNKLKLAKIKNAYQH